MIFKYLLTAFVLMFLYRVVFSTTKQINQKQNHQDNSDDAVDIDYEEVD